MKWPWRKPKPKSRLNSQVSIEQRRKMVRNLPNRGNLSTKGKQLGSTRQKKLFKERLDNITGFLMRNFKYFAFPLVFLIFIGAGFALKTLLEATNYFSIKEVVVIGIEEGNQEEVLSFLDSYKNLSMIGLSSDAVEENIQSNFRYVKKAYVNKFLPHTLEVEIEERFPKFAYYNLAGAYLIDEDGAVVSVIDQLDEEPVGYSDEEVSIIDGYIDINSARIQAEFYRDWEEVGRINRAEKLGIEPESVPDPEWKSVKRKVKQKIAQELAEEYRLGLQTRLERFEVAIEEVEIQNLPRLTDLGVELLENGQSLSAEKVEFLERAMLVSSEAGYKIKNIKWSSSFNIILEIASGTQLVFTSTKSFEQQFEALQAVQNVEKVNRRQEVDLRGDLVAVK